MSERRVSRLSKVRALYFLRDQPLIFSCTAALDAALAESKAQLEKIEQLEQELFELGGEIAGGRHVPPGVRVLSFKDTPELLLRDNPETRQTEMNRLKEENAALILRIEELQQGGARVDSGPNGGEHLIPKESWYAVCKERDELQASVKQKETRLKRLQEVCCSFVFVLLVVLTNFHLLQIFSSKALEFRESVAALLGVKLAFFPSGQVRVTSLYDLSATFVFNPSSNGATNMQLTAQGEGGPEDLPNLMTYWVGTEQCIPGFLASVTLELYERWKRDGRPTQDKSEENIISAQ
jgi:mitotic spindle assembly checkpoint protein MAD1